MSEQAAQQYQYDIALSFAGEDRSYADKIASLLKQRGINVFYDKFEQADLWGRDLYAHLADVYTNRARYCIMLLSRQYAAKAWTNHERMNAQERAFRERQEYILPVRLDDTVIPGIRQTIGYLDLRTTSIEELVAFVERKLGRAHTDEMLSPAVGIRVPSAGAARAIPLPKMKKAISQRDRDRFLSTAFEGIRQYMREALSQLEAGRQDIETDFVDIHSRKYICRIYVRGERKVQCKIWVGGLSSLDSIAYSEGSADIDNDQSMNDYLSIGDKDGELFLKPSGMWLGGPSGRDDLLSIDEAAEYLWARLTHRLSQ